MEDLVRRFHDIALAQDRASRNFETGRYNRLYKQMVEVRDALKSRSGDQRRALRPFLESNNPQVRLKAAITLLAIYPELARRTLEHIRDEGADPQRLDAGMLLSSLDDGSFVPT
ncbi:MAG: DUF2019 domain-containing protein [Xanthobacteraceae bacterium]|nr:DUF2019 domain-containing protein [Xanthobacteraceae bacterium]